MMPEIQRIGIAVVSCDKGYLVGTRGPDGPLAGYAEFPGGKCLSGESFAACAERECLEETGLPVTAEEVLLSTRHTYPHGTVDLEFWSCRPCAGAVLAEEQRGFRWVTATGLRDVPFPAANAPLIDLLCQRSPESFGPL